MHRTGVCAGLLVLAAGAAFGQTGEARADARFLAADVRHSKPTMVPSMIGPSSDGDLYQVRYAIMVDLIRMAYNVEKDKVTDGPIWISMYRYDIKAKAPSGSTAEDKRLMLRNLLAERFHLVAHPGIKQVPGYILTAGKHPQLKQAAGTEQAACIPAMHRPPDGAPAESTPTQIMTVTCHNITMQAFIDTVRNLPRATRAQANPPIVDKTDLSGAWNFEFHYDVLAARGDNDTVFAQVFDQQLGLKLEESSIPVPAVQVESMDFDPTPNPPDLAKYFPLPPAQFDVAEIKPSAPPTPGAYRPFEIRNGRVILTGMSMRSLIGLAWDLEDTELVGAPKWMDAAHFDIIAKTPDSVRVDMVRSPMDLEPLQPMLRSLLTERFKMKVHTEDRPADAYVLKSVKPKLTATADPKRRAGWHDGPPYATKDPNLLNTALGRVITCTNLSMAEFARLLPGMDPSAFHHPVRDATGITGTFDFTINFERYAILAGGRGGSIVFTPSGIGMVGGNGPETTDPSGKVSIYEAVSKQLGLKLELEKRPFPVLVIDSIEEKPVDN